MDEQIQRQQILENRRKSLWQNAEEKLEWTLVGQNEPQVNGLEKTKQGKHVLEQYKEEQMIKSLQQYSDEYVELKQRILADRIGTSRQKAERLFLLMRPFEINFTYYQNNRNLVKSQKKSDKIDRMIDEYNLLRVALAKDEDMDSNILLEMAGFHRNAETERNTKSIIRKKAMKLSNRQLAPNWEQGEMDAQAELNRQTENEKMSESMNALQLGAVTAIDQWIARRARYETANQAFVAKVLSLSPRERLFLYSVIEDGVDESLTDFQLYYDMTVRIPSPEKFVKKMRSSNIKFWKKIRHTNIVWEKLAVAYRIVTGKREQLIEAVSERQQGWENEDRDYGNIKSLLYQDATNAEELYQIDDVLDNIPKNMAYRNKIDDRDSALMGFNNAAVDAFKALETYRSTASFNWIGKRRRKKKLQEKTMAVVTAREEYIAKVNGLAEFLIEQIKDNPYMREKYGDNPEEALQQVYGRLAHVDSGSEAYRGEESQGAQWLLKQGISVGSLSNKYVDALGLSSYGQVNGLMLTTGAFSLFGGSVALLGLVKQYKALLEGMDTLGDAELASAIFKTSMNTVSGLWSAAAGTTTLVYASSIATVKDATQLAAYAGTYGKDAAQVLGNHVTWMSKGLAAGGATVSTLAFAAQAGDAVVQTKQRIQLHSAEKQLHEQLQNQMEAGQLTDEDKEYTENLLKLTKRKKTVALINSAISTTASAYSSGVAIASLVAPGAGAAIASLSGFLVGAGAGLATMIISYLGNKYNRRKSCDDFLKIADWDDFEMSDADKETIKNDLKDEKFRRQVINELLAEFGYNSIDSFYGYVVREYANFVYYNLFFTQEGTPVYRKANGSSDEPEKAEKTPWVTYCKSLGLRVRFPKKGEDEGREPVETVIAQKMM